ncbi:Lysophospholipase nte-1 [Gossypium arboreum]|uniref:Small ribosomal subunit protein mS23 n=1 Tax=Gossypium arboreum TaxID=29729 RepID=A0A0B0P7B7_GOSAR|nr:Lysophospholipase nte-1 [Gossypium arboreum]KHG20772.1 Lysophospholipase nte-1 [Gossypium arboreum]KHG20907.1 Lysophospholipase nte-1 [Gossypium arboreum]KHG28043.1 Lysophospholipase nte-1 [Gossypium arboreum]
MSFMKGDLLTKTRKLVNGLAKPQPVWLKAMEQAPPATFPRPDGKLKAISLPEDVYIKKFFQKYPVAKGHDAIKKQIKSYEFEFSMRAGYDADIK